jgi:hypothetical protein
VSSFEVRGQATTTFLVVKVNRHSFVLENEQGERFTVWENRHLTVTIPFNANLNPTGGTA